MDRVRMGRAVGAFAGLSLALTTMLAGAAPAVASDAQVARDARGDATASLDIVRVKVTHTKRVVRVAVKLRDYVDVNDTHKGYTQVGAHIDTRGGKRPEHLVAIRGYHVLSGSTSGWNKLNPNGFDPWGDCWVEGVKFVTVRAAKNLVILRAPKKCLGNPKRVRVAVQTYRSGADTHADWLKGKRKVLPYYQLR